MIFLFILFYIKSQSSSYINFFILPIVVTLMWSGNIGLAIRNLVKEKEKFIEEVNIFIFFITFETQIKIFRFYY
jgi:predicted neutral ceramidase superfamily lipid hydrolase